MSAKGKLVCQVCGAALANDSEACPVCALRGALGPETTSLLEFSSELRFEHYQVLKNKDGTPVELGRGAMGITYKALDIHLQCPVALKIINARFLGDDSARRRFVREARAAASVRHPNVASVFHLGESCGNYFYAMEFVEGETLQKLIQRSGRLETSLALEIVAQVAAGLAAIHKQHLVHRDIKPSNIMVSWEEGRLERVKIIDLGVAKGPAEETISTGGFIGTPGYASPEQFAGIGIDIRSDLYSLGITLWEMLSGNLPFRGSAAELMDRHQHAVLPIEKLKSVPAPNIALLEILLAKDPGQRFQNPAQLQKALPKVREALASGSHLTTTDLRSFGGQISKQLPTRRRSKQTLRWLLASGLSLIVLLLGLFYFPGYRAPFNGQPKDALAPTDKSIAVLPFESLSENKRDGYFADGVQDEILNNLGKIAQLKVISRTSVMQYRADAKRDLRQIANALGVANVLEGTVRRDGNRVRVSTQLVDAHNDNTVWADSYDRNLTDIFAIQSDVARTIASKLTATLSPEEKKRIDSRPTDNLEAYDLYLQAKESVADASVSFSAETSEKLLRKAIGLLEQAVRLDPEFALAYCTIAETDGLLYSGYDPTSERRALADAAINTALRLRPDLPEVHLAYANHLYRGYRDYERARVQLAIAKRASPNSAEALLLGAHMDCRQGNWEQAIQEFNDAIARDPRNPPPIMTFADALRYVRRFRAAEKVYDRLTELLPDQQPMLKVLKMSIAYLETGDATALRSAIAELPASMADDRDMLSWRLSCALSHRDWPQARDLLEKMKGSEDTGFAYVGEPVPLGCRTLLLARVRGEKPDANPTFRETREQLNQKVQESPANANLLSQLAVVDALLGEKDTAVSESKRAVEILPISKDAWEGPGLVLNLAIVYAWTDELGLAFETLGPLTKIPGGIYLGPLKVDPFWDPLRKDPRFDKLLAELAPHD